MSHRTEFELEDGWGTSSLFDSVGGGERKQCLSWCERADEVTEPAGACSDLIRCRLEILAAAVGGSPLFLHGWRSS